MLDTVQPSVVFITGITVLVRPSFTRFARVGTGMNQPPPAKCRLPVQTNSRSFCLKQKERENEYNPKWTHK